MTYIKEDKKTSVHFRVKYQWGEAEMRMDRATRLSSVSMHVEDEFQGKGFSKQLVRDLCNLVNENNSAPEWVYIDTDASAGFWAYVGFVNNPLERDQTRPEYGYEKRCSWKVFEAFGMSEKLQTKIGLGSDTISE